MLIQEMNLDAMKRTLDLMVGPKGTELIALAYKAVNEAMQSAYNEGFAGGQQSGFDAAYEVAKIDVEVDVEERLDNAFDEGFMHGMAQAEEDADQSYIDGVADARARPAVADENVQEIIGVMAQEALNIPDADFYAALDEYTPRLITLQEHDEQVQDEA
jgi:hypothetical protein